MLKKITCAVLTAVLLVFSAGGTVSYAETNPFGDIEITVEEISSFGYDGNAPLGDALTDIYEEVRDSVDEHAESRRESGTDDSVLETMMNETLTGDAADSFDSGNKERMEDSFIGASETTEDLSGNKTEIYEDGSVLTEKSDGTKEGISSDGTRVTVDSNGNTTYHFADGSQGIKHADGLKEQIFPDGTKLIERPDGSQYTYEATGYYTDLDDQGNVTRVWYDNGESIDLFDENGDIFVGEKTITGPNGETFTYKGDAGYDEDGNYVVREFSFSASGNGKEFHLETKGDGKGGCSIDYSDPDGNSFEAEFGENGNRVDASSGDGQSETHYSEKDGKGSFTSREGDETSSMKWAEGKDSDSFEMAFSDGRTMNITTDKDGNVIKGNVKTADGLTVTADGDRATIEDAKTGLYIEKDQEGIKQAHIPREDGSSFDFGNGTGVLVDNATGNKVMWTHDQNGDLTILSPDGEYTTDENGNLYKDGEPVLYNGIQVNTETGLSLPGESSGEDTPKSTPEDSEPEETAGSGTLALPDICGRYDIGGYVSFYDYEDETTESEYITGSITVRAEGDVLYIEDADGGVLIAYDYDPGTGVCNAVYEEDEEALSEMHFTRDGNRIRLTIYVTEDFDFGKSTGELTGYRY